MYIQCNYIYIYIYICSISDYICMYICNAIDFMYIYMAQRLECSPMARETWVQSQVESYQRL